MEHASDLKRKLLSAMVACITTAILGACLFWSQFSDRPWLVGTLLLLLLFLLSIFVALYLGRLSKDIASMEIALFNLVDNNFSITVPEPQLREMQAIRGLMNKTFADMRQQRQEIHQKELLLDKVIESSPLAMVLSNHQGQIVFSNSSAWHLFHGGRPMNGLAFKQLLAEHAKEFTEVVENRSEALFNCKQGQEQQSFHYSWGRFSMDNHEHSLHLFKELTREISRQEVAIWKKTIKVISHELNNSLAPISSLAHSSKILVDKGDTLRLKKVLERIEDNVMSLHEFIQRYASFARLPLPNKTALNWAALLHQLQDHYPFLWQQDLPGWSCEADNQQLQQALVNVLKNAHESGTDPAVIELRVEQQAGKTFIHVLDRGQGMSSDVMSQALIPFYSTKNLGSGIGLALCHEIISAHDGKLLLQNRGGGGLRVSLMIP